MKSISLGLTLLLLAACSRTGTIPLSNPQPLRELGCIPLTSVSNDHTPPELFRAGMTCAKAGDYSTSAMLIKMGRIFSAFDGRRVADETAPQAAIVALMNASQMLTKEQVDALDTYTETYKDHPNFKATICQTVQRTGAPTYYPYYMTLHGIRGLGLQPDFNAAATWQELIEKNKLCAQ